MNNYVQPYYLGGQMQQPYGYQPAYNTPTPSIQPQVTQIPKIQPTDLFSRLQGKSVDSIDVVKAMDIPLDGSVSYFPLTDGTAIVTKQLQQDGTSKTIVYKPVEQEIPLEKNEIKYMTIDEFNEKIKNLDSGKELKEELKNLKKQIKNLTDELDELKDKED